jgi:hypothetical protein
MSSEQQSAGGATPVGAPEAEIERMREQVQNVE